MAPPKLLSVLRLGALSVLFGCSVAKAADVDATASYIISLGGINVADVKVKLADSAQHYDIALSANVTGLGGLVASGTAKAESTGTSSGNALTAEKFDLATHANSEDFTINVQYAHGDVSAFVVQPPVVNDINRVPIERSQLLGVGDMLSGFILKGSSLDHALCQRKMRVFTGLERFDLAMSFLADDKATSLRTGYQGPVVQCRLKYTPISGHFTTSQMTNYLAQSDRIFIWYAPMAATGFFIPYRVLITTSMGDLSMVLTGLK